MYPLTHVGTFNTRWHLEHTLAPLTHVGTLTKKRGASRQNQGIPQSGQKPSFCTNSVSLIKLY